MNQIDSLKDLIFGSKFKAQLVKEGLGSLFIKVAYVFVSFLMGVVLVRVLGAENYGIYGYVLSIIRILNIPAEFGLPNLIIRETAKNLVFKQWKLLRGLWSWSVKTVLIIGSILLFGTFSYLYFSRNTIDSAILETITYAIFLLPILALGHLRKSQLMCLDKVVLAQLPEQVLQPAMVGLFVLFVPIKFNIDIKASHAMGLTLLAAGIAFIIGTILLFKNIPENIRHAKPEYDKKAWIKSAIPFAGNSGMQILNKQASVIILGIFASAADIGFYKLAVSLAISASIGTQVVTLVVIPKFSSLYAKKDMQRLQKLVRASALISFLISSGVFFFFFIFGRQFLGLVYGRDFHQALTPLLILLVGQFLNASTGPAGQLLNMTGYELMTMKGIGISLISNVILNFLLIPRYSYHGAAIATALSLILFNFVLWKTIKKRLGINSFVVNL